MRPEKIDFPDSIPVSAFVRSLEQYPYHWHDTLEIIQVLRGSANVDLGSDNLLLRENEIAVVNIGELHRITKGDEDNEILFIHIGGNFCKSTLSDRKYLFIYCSSVYHKEIAPEKYERLNGYIARLVSALCEKLQNEKTYREHMKSMESLLSSMLNYLAYNFDYLRWGYGAEAFADPVVNRFRYIAEHTDTEYEVQMGLKDLAAELKVSLQHLSRDIKEKFGLTFQELLYYGKCAYAAKLLLASNKRIVDIALDCGFSDVKYLIKHFKQFFRHTPSEFRRLYRTDEKTLFAGLRYCDLLLTVVLRNIKAD